MNNFTKTSNFKVYLLFKLEVIIYFFYFYKIIKFFFDISNFFYNKIIYFLSLNLIYKFEI